MSTNGNREHTGRREDNEKKRRGRFIVPFPNVRLNAGRWDFARKFPLDFRPNWNSRASSPAVPQGSMEIGPYAQI